MNTFNYTIELAGQVDLDELNSLSPLQVNLIHSAADCTLVRVQTDQSGLVGLLRHIHSRGILLLAFTREENEPAARREP